MEIVIRIFVIYLFIVFGLRVMGKREFSELSPLELVTLLLVPEIVTDSLLGENPSMTAALIGVATLFTLVYLSSLWQYHSKTAKMAVEGAPVVLVDRSQMVRRAMDEERIGADELFAEMHRAGLEDLSQVKWAILETDGRIAFIPYGPSRKQGKSMDNDLTV